MKNKLRISLEYGAEMFWEYDSNGNFVDNNSPSNYDLSLDLQNELFELNVLYQRTLNQDYPPDSGFEDESEEQEFESRMKEALTQLRLELGDRYNLEFSNNYP